MTQPLSPSRSPSLESILCTRCGLCCNGSFFADIELTGAREATSLESAGLEIEDDSLLLQPCLALRGTRCSMYAHRPKCCRTFECLLLQRAKRGDISIIVAKQKIDAALAQAKRIHHLLAKMPETELRLPLKERCQEAIALSDENPARSQRESKISTQLENAIASLEITVNETFLHSHHANRA